MAPSSNFFLDTFCVSWFSELTVKHTATRIKSQLKRHRITQERVAAVAAVDRTMVNKVVNGRAKSERVLIIAEQLIRLAQTSPLPRRAA